MGGIRKIALRIKMEDFMFIEKNNLVIRNATVEDGELLAKWWNDGKVMAHAGFPNGIGVRAENIAQSIEREDDHTHRTLIIEVDDMSVGEMSYRNVGDKTAEIGIKICDFSKQEKGYGTVLLSMLINSLLNEWGYHKIILDTNVNNKRAQHVYEKLGFRKVRVNVDAWKDQLGEVQSSIDYEMAKEDFVKVDKG